DVERTSLHTIAAADAVLLVEVDDAVRVLHDGTRRRTGFETARIGAVHAAVLADQPLQVLCFRIDPFREAHDRQAGRREIERVVVDAVIDAHLLAQIVPLEAGDLARFAADAL